METGLSRKEEYSHRLSPFRYPGGKAFLFETLLRCVKTLDAPDVVYVEPFAGGAGAALILLATGAVQRIVLNDADRCVYTAWKSIIDETDRFVDELYARPLDMNTWAECKSIVDDADNFDDFELGFATFFLNRTNRSGILRGAGPIGGYSQSGKWKLGARFYRETLVGRVKKIGALSERISLSNEDGLTFLKMAASKLAADTTFYFIDPPYVQAGDRLYLNTMTEADHVKLSKFLKQGSLTNWLLTYDDAELIRTAYEEIGVERISIPYSLQRKRKEKEIVVYQLGNGKRPVCC